MKYVFSGPDESGYRGTRPVLPGLRENLGALPRAWIAYSWTPAHGQADAMRRVARAKDLTVPVLDGVPPPPAGAPRGVDRVRFVTDNERTVVLDVQAPRAGFLILGDTYYPGWQAKVDNEPVDVHAADVAFRAVSVPAGRHVVRFDYRPASVRIGGAVTVFALLLITVGLLSPKIRCRYR